LVFSMDVAGRAPASAPAAALPSAQRLRIG
jgi:hypothetical protein